MNPCVSEEALVALATGEGTRAERAHVRECKRCTARASALSDDLTLLRQALLEAPLPGAVHAPRRHWTPIAGALLATAMLALVWAAPWRSAPSPSRPLRVGQTASLARDVSVALFDPARTVTVAPGPDSAYLEAALNGGWSCGGLGMYGVDCRGADALALYEE
jgi:hypothetical protein